MKYRRQTTQVKGSMKQQLNQTMNDMRVSPSRDNWNSPNVSRISPVDITQPIQDDSMVIQVNQEVDKSLIKLDTSNNILQNFDSEINNDDMPSDEEDCEENPELLAELERKQEEFIEELMEKSFDVKAE